MALCHTSVPASPQRSWSVAQASVCASRRAGPRPPEFGMRQAAAQLSAHARSATAAARRSMPAGEMLKWSSGVGPLPATTGDAGGTWVRWRRHAAGLPSAPWERSLRLRFSCRTLGPNPVASTAQASLVAGWSPTCQPRRSGWSPAGALLATRRTLILPEVVTRPNRVRRCLLALGHLVWRPEGRPEER